MYRRSQLPANYAVFPEWTNIWKQIDIPDDPNIKGLSYYKLGSQSTSIIIYRMNWKLSLKDGETIEPKIKPVKFTSRSSKQLFDHIILLDGQALFTAFEPQGIKHIRMLPGSVIIAKRNHRYTFECADADISKNIVFMLITKRYPYTDPNILVYAYTKAFYAPSLRSLWTDANNIRIDDYSELIAGSIRPGYTSHITTKDNALDNSVLFIVTGAMESRLRDVQINSFTNDSSKRDYYESNTMIVINTFEPMDLINTGAETCLYVIIRPGGINRHNIAQRDNYKYK
jgi:hypothetical protein